MPHTLFVLPVVLASMSGGVSKLPVFSELRNCDLVIVGEVTSIQRSLESAVEALPMVTLQQQGYFTAITRVRMEISEVMWGQASHETLEFVVFASASGFRDDYEIGQHVLVGLVWGEDVLGGNYWLRSDDGRLVLRGDRWEAKDASFVLQSLSPLREAFSSVAPSVSIEQADIVVIARIRNVAREQKVDAACGVTAYMHILLEDIKPLSGGVADSLMSVTQITSGDDWPEWRDDVPFRYPEQGKAYCFALRRIPTGYAIVNGINGVWEVRGEDLYFPGRSRAGLTVPMIRQIRRGVQ